jgi:UDP-N-acetyl-D-galactosamine dehydrogenase
MRNLENIKIAIIGLGYVGLPLAIEFGKKYSCLGFDISESRVSELLKGKDRTLEADETELKNMIVGDFESFKTVSIGFFPTNKKEDLSLCNVFIVTVPTPIDDSKKTRFDTFNQSE